MFGYVKPCVPLLRVKDNEFYRAVYCGLCGCLNSCNGCSSSLTLSYDMAFLAVVRLALAGEESKLAKKRCIASPLRKKVRVLPSPQLEFCASLGVLLAYYKVIDSIRDEKGFKRLGARMYYPVIAHNRKKALNVCGKEADSVIKEHLERLNAIEADRTPAIDLPSDVFGEMLSALASLGLEGREAIIAREAGFAVGKWIYIMDALDDCSDDIRKSSYNPVLLLYGGRLPEHDDVSNIMLALKATKDRLLSALELIDFEKEEKNECLSPEGPFFFSDELRAIIMNIATLGLEQAEEKIAKKFSADGSVSE